jgi:predicted DNA-binding protein
MKSKPITFRPNKENRERLEILAKTTERPVTYFIEKALEAELPTFEQEMVLHIKLHPALHKRLNETAASLGLSFKEVLQMSFDAGINELQKDTELGIKLLPPPGSSTKKKKAG